MCSLAGMSDAGTKMELSRRQAAIQLTAKAQSQQGTIS